MDLKYIAVSEKIIENKKKEMLWVMKNMGQHGNVSESLKATWVRSAKNIKAKSDELEKERNKAIEQIKQMNNPKYSQVLMMKYVDRLMNHEIAEIMSCSRIYIQKLLQEALKEYERMQLHVK